MNLSEAKRLTDQPELDAYPYDRAHRELSTARACTCELKAGSGPGGLITAEQADPDCELHFPWMREDDADRVAGMREWMAGYQCGYQTADGLTARQAQLVQDLIGYALDQAHDIPDWDYLQETYETTADELLQLAQNLQPTGGEQS